MSGDVDVFDAASLLISGEQFQRFMDAKSPNDRCPGCGENKWELPLLNNNDAGKKDAPIQMAALPGLGNHLAIPVHTPMCVSCGYIKLISAVIVRRWVSENE